jgi:hypothetical protein
VAEARIGYQPFMEQPKTLLSRDTHERDLNIRWPIAAKEVNLEFHGSCIGKAHRHLDPPPSCARNHFEITPFRGRPNGLSRRQRLGEKKSQSRLGCRSPHLDSSLASVAVTSPFLSENAALRGRLSLQRTARAEVLARASVSAASSQRSMYLENVSINCALAVSRAMLGGSGMVALATV